MVTAAMGLRAAVFLALLSFGIAEARAAGPAREACQDLLPIAAVARPARDIEPLDLVRLRDVGHPDSAYVAAPSPFGVAPDGRSVAFILSRADPATNGYCRALLVLPLTPGAVPRLVDKGGELITDQGAYRGLLVQTGSPTVVQPIWSPDGRWIAYLRRDGGVTRLWRARTDGGEAGPVTPPTIDVERFAWSSAGSLAYAYRASAAERREPGQQSSGILYDWRIVPNVGLAPRTPATSPLIVETVDLQSGIVRPAATGDRDTLGAPEVWARPRAAAREGRRAWVEPDPDNLLGPGQLVVSAPDGETQRCAASTCRGRIVGLWFTPDARALLVLRREGWANGLMALDRIDLQSMKPRRLLATGDMLLGCAAAGDRLICTRESTTTPRRIVAIAMSDGGSTVLFDPNPEFARLRLGPVERIFWKNDLGLEARGDLVLPPDHRAGERLPLVVVQYHSDGFLRGGTGDEYPIFAFAARGFAVLSVEQPAIVASRLKSLRTYEDANAANLKDWVERRSLLSSLEIAVGRVVEKGLADPARIGITGLSDGATSVAFALINSRLFSAAAISTCCMDPWSSMALGGPAYSDHMRRVGYSPASAGDEAFWRPLALTLNAASVETPLLMQLADDEYLFALPAFTALREQGQPVEMHIFPGEHHNKVQPTHRLAIYERNLDWFDFWLRDREDPDPAKRERYARWRDLKRLSHASARVDQTSTQASTSAIRISR